MTLRALDLDFIRKTPLRSAWRHLLIVLASAALLVAGGYYLDARSSDTLLQAEHAQKLTRLRSSAPPEISASDQRALMERVKGVNPYIRKLNLPWDAILFAVIPPQALPIHLLALEATGQSDGLRISAITGRPEDLTEYVAYLGEKRLFREVFLLQHEVQSDGQLRFDVEVRWNTKP